MEKMILLMSRASAYAADYLLYWTVLFFIGKYGAFGYVAALLLFFGYRYASTAMFGRTAGMLVFKLSLDRWGWGLCLKRELARIASALYFVGYIVPVFDKRGRTLHDLFSGTCVGFTSGKTTKNAGDAKDIRADGLTTGDTHRQHQRLFILKLVVMAVIFVNLTRWFTGIMIDDFGNLGLTKIGESRVYNQSFDGDNLMSLSQSELYLQTLGRRYTAVIESKHSPLLIRLANKKDHSEIYKMSLEGKELKGSLLYKFPIPFQYICSGLFRSEKELCGISPEGLIVLVDSKGRSYAKIIAKTRNIMMAKCGDINRDKKDEIVLLGRGGDLEVFEYEASQHAEADGGVLRRVYFGKPGDDINISAFFIQDGLIAAALQDSKTGLYKYIFENGSFLYTGMKLLNVNEQMQIESFDSTNKIMLSFIRRNNMTLRVGKLQRLQVYEYKQGHEELAIAADFGNRPSRGYLFKVRNYEEIADIDKDGISEVILKAVHKEDSMGGQYKLEIYHIDNTKMRINRLLLKIGRLVGR